MADATRQTLQEFAYSTGHRDYEVDEPRHVALLARKFLATQAPIVDDFKRVYPYVSDDLERLEFRAKANRTPTDWSRSVRVGLPVYQYLCSEATLPKGVYSHFAAHLGPQHEKDAPLLFFMHGARNKNLDALLSELYEGKMSERQIQALYHHIRDYRVPEQEDAHQVAREVGTAIATMALPRIEQLGEVFITADLDEETEKEVQVATQAAPMKLATTTPTKHELRLQDNPILKEYRHRAGLPLHFSPDKVLRQIVVSCLVAPEHQVRVATSVMGKRQQQLATVDASAMDAQDWQHLLDVATSELDREVTMANEQVRAFYDALRKCMPRKELQAMTHADLVQHLISAYIPNHHQRIWPTTTKQVSAALRNFVKIHPTIDDALVAQLVGK